MVLDGHIHISQPECRSKEMLAAMLEAGVDGGVVISRRPTGHAQFVEPMSSTERLERLLEWTTDSPNICGLYWIDPLEGDALEQVSAAVEAGVQGFKVICDHFMPSDERAMPVYQEIARNNRPILFHSGILWDGKVSSLYNRPAEFEALMDVEGLKFCLAHVSWPWCDECIAVYGKFLHGYTVRPQSAEMFIDITPGTPPVYRKEVLTKLFTIGYNVQDNIIFGTDCMADTYDPAWAREWLTRDREIYDQIGLGSDVVEKINGGNLRRFLGLA